MKQLDTKPRPATNASDDTQVMHLHQSVSTQTSQQLSFIFI